MKNKEVKGMLPLNLQFFASDNEDGKEDSKKKGAGENEDDSDEDDSDEDEDSKEKTFTQAEVTAMMTAEKKKGKRSILKALGFKNEDEAMRTLSSLRDNQKENKSSDEEKQKNLENEKTEAEKRAEMAENKLSCIMAGVRKDSVDDALAIALLKVSDDKDLDDVLEEMSKQKKYQGFFNSSDKDEKEDKDDKGTGKGPGKDKKTKVPDNYGKTLAERSAKSVTSQQEGRKSYFSR